MNKFVLFLLPCYLFATFAHAALIEKRDTDVTILEAWITDPIGEETEQRDGFDHQLCNGNDCTAAVEAKTGVPLLNKFNYRDYHRNCEMIEVRTVVPEEAFFSPLFQGIGFFLASTDCGIRSRYDLGNSGFVPKSKMLIVGKVILKDGRRALIHRFHAQGICTGPIDTNFNIDNRHGVEFRPYARFDNEGNEYRNWDYVPNDYKLGCVAADSSNSPVIFNAFNRRSEILSRK